MKPCPTCDGTGLFCVSMSRDFCGDCFGTGDADADENTPQPTLEELEARTREARRP